MRAYINIMKEFVMKKTNLIDVYTIILAIAGASAVILRTIACLASFDTVIMHFDNSLCNSIANGLVITSLLVFATYLFMESKDFCPIASNDNAATYIPAGILSIALLFVAADRSVAFRQDYLFADGVLRYLCLAVVILAIVSVAAFFLMIFITKNESTVKAAMFLGFVLYLCAYSAYLYFNRSVHPTNSPIKVVDQMAYLFSALFFLYETRITIGRPVWRPYVALGLVSSLMTAYSALPTLITYIGSGRLLSDSIYETAVTLALCAFTTSRVLLTKKLCDSEQCQEAMSIQMLFELREKEMADRKHRPLAREDDIIEENDTVDAENYSFDIPPVEPSAEGNDE